MTASQNSLYFREWGKVREACKKQGFPVPDRKLLVRELGTDDVGILLAWQRLAIELAALWNAHIKLAKEHGDIGFIREQEAVAELRRLCATLPPNKHRSGQIRHL
jgi:hypothetical protein